MEPLIIIFPLFVTVFIVGANSSSDFIGVVAAIGGERARTTVASSRGPCRGSGCPVAGHGHPEQDATDALGTYVRDDCYIDAGPDGGAIVHNPMVTVKPLTALAAPVAQACCNQSAVHGALAAVVARMEETYSRDEEDVRLQVRQLQTAISDLTVILRKLPGKCLQNRLCKMKVLLVMRLGGGWI